MLKIENISKSFHNKKILDNISLSIKKGEIVLLVGSSGVGKSTLLRILANLETPSSGTLYFEEKKLTPQTINKNHLVGLIFQNFNLFEHTTVLKNITFVIEKVENVKPKKAREIAIKILEQYGLQNFTNTYPAQLSGGQKQRLAIARSLALNPKVICFDEPTSALDPSLTNVFAENIKTLARKNLVIIITTHNMSLLKKLPATICLMKNGKIVETCTNNDFNRSPERYPHLKIFIKGN